eukprot:TRINITY_DN15264_c0_g1_i1.p1 TRINITY_DN15264_c0_g1~~TRINITY_DN15264_c0_g1_i1.p1  ORF type:complete len:189 (-),score=23.61 TRINITY_DN15264_c0_g1_i1:704-1270(-)
MSACVPNPSPVHTSAPDNCTQIFWASRLSQESMLFSWQDPDISIKVRNTFLDFTGKSDLEGASFVRSKSEGSLPGLSSSISEAVANGLQSTSASSFGTLESSCSAAGRSSDLEVVEECQTHPSNIVGQSRDMPPQIYTNLGQQTDVANDERQSQSSSIAGHRSDMPVHAERVEYINYGQQVEVATLHE